MDIVIKRKDFEEVIKSKLMLNFPLNGIETPYYNLFMKGGGK